MDCYSVNDYCREHFGKKLYKLALDGGFTCPNRDGTLGKDGCIFCSGAGSGEFAEHGSDIAAQIENAKKRVAAKAGNCGYIAYFQSFTNTYAPTEHLRKLFMSVITRNDIDILSVATRPDCLEDDKIALLHELNSIKPVWVELGLQTSNETTAEYIRRGYKNGIYTDAVHRLKQAGIYVITHMIIGLPGETADDMKGTLKFMLDAGTDGVKLQLLHIIKGTELYEQWKQGLVQTLTKDEYLKILSELLPMLPPDKAVHRITGDGDKRTLAAPLWSANKKDVMNSIKNYNKNIPVLPDYVKSVTDRLEQNGFEAYLVGGCIRDHLLGKTPKDYDIAVSSFPEETKRCFADHRVIDTGIKFGTVTVVSEGNNLELTSFRFDGEYSGFRRPNTVEFTRNIHADVARRDFTVNAIAYSPKHGYVDDFGGAEDLKSRIIRCVGDPEKRFSEDALRIMRALRFSSVLDFTVEGATAEAALKLKDNLKSISPERIFTELKKLMGGINAEHVLIKYRTIQETFMPEISCLSPAQWARNARNTVACTTDAMRFAALLTGLSADTCGDICRRLHTDNKFRISVVFFISYRDHVFRSVGEAKRLAGEKGSDRLTELLIFRQNTGIVDNTYLQKAVEDIKQGSCLSIKDLAVNGSDMEKLGFKGKAIGVVLDALLDEVTENDVSNDRITLTDIARSMLNG